MDLWRIMDHQTHSGNDVQCVFPFDFHFIRDWITNGTVDCAPALQMLEVQGTRMERGMQAVRRTRLHITYCAAFLAYSIMVYSQIGGGTDRRLAVVSGSVGTSILNDSSLPASLTRDPSGPFPPPHVNEFEYRNSSGSQRFDRQYSTPLPVYAYPRAPSEFVDCGHVHRQRRPANSETTIRHEYHTDDSHTGRPEVVVPTFCSSGRFKEPLEGNIFAHGGSLKRSPQPKQREHARSMASKSGTMEHNSCREMVREPEEVSSNMSTLTRRPSISPTHPTEPNSSSKRTTFISRAFKVNASLKAAAASTVLPTPYGKRTNVADFVTFITAADPQAVTRKCKLCQEHIAKKDSLVKHWIRVHAFTDLQVALTYPYGDHSNLVINTTQRRDILLAALYTCPLKGCRGLSKVGVFVTQNDLLRHVRRHYKFLKKASGEEKAQGTQIELEQMREQVTKYLYNHTFWHPVDRAHFTSREYKLVWLLNQ
ncbi:hypothetical protein BU17DRAFT_85161 [Hysterangium stoloniferum]|nr:hypothetical protein BU17DRAFT_85161 [Hysterangium stoloniferum]